MAGRLPSITPDKKLHRSNEELRDRSEETPIYQRQEFRMPRTLTKEERKVWKFLVQVFRETVNCRVSDADVDMMVLYCRAKVATDEADAALKADPRAYLVYECGEDKDGNPKYVLKANPNIRKRNDNAALPLAMGLAVLVRVDALVLDVVTPPEWHGGGALVLAATAVLMLLLSLVVARSLGGMIVCALSLPLLQVAMVERQKRLVMPGELVHVFVVGPERLVEEQKL